MKKLLLALIAALPLWPAYVYHQTDTFATFQPNNWTQNGAVNFGTAGLTASTSAGGSLISSLAVPNGNAAQELRVTYRLTVSGGNYVAYLKASSNAYLGSTPTGTFYALELQNPTFSGGICSSTLALYKRVSNVLTQISSTAVACHDGLVLRAAIKADGTITATWDSGHLLATDTSIASGQPGVGVRGTPAGNAIARADAGPGDTLATGNRQQPGHNRAAGSRGDAVAGRHR